MDQQPQSQPEPLADDLDVEGHSLLVEAQGREMQERRYREARDVNATPQARSSKPSRPGRLRRLFGG